MGVLGFIPDTAFTMKGMKGMKSQDPNHSGPHG